MPNEKGFLLCDVTGLKSKGDPFNTSNYRALRSDQSVRSQ